MLSLFSPLMSTDTSFVSIYLRKWISQSGWVALSKVSLKPPLTPFSSSFPKDSSILAQETSGFHQRVNTWIVPSFRVEALGQSLLGVYRLPCEELWDAGIRSMWHCMDQNQTLGPRLKADTPPDYSRIASDHPAVCSFPRRKKVRGISGNLKKNFFQVLFTTTRFSSVLSCEDLLISGNLST